MRFSRRGDRLSQLAAIDKGFENILLGAEVVTVDRLSTERASVEKKPSTRLSQEPCLGAKVNSNRCAGWPASQAPPPLARLQLVVTIQIEGTARPSFLASDHAAYGLPS
jgi:hypothetical protein